MEQAIIYGRLSDDPNGEAEAVTHRQIPDCQRYCADQGLSVYKVLIDNDISASRYSTSARPAYEEGIALVRDSTVTTIVAWHLDRLYRQPRELEQLIDLADKGTVKIRTLYGDYDLTKSDDRFMARLMVNLAAKESDDKSRRLTRKHADLAAKGMPSGGPRSFGWNKAMTDFEPAEADAIRWAVDEIMKGWSLRAIATEWNDRGLATPRGNRWMPQTVSKCLRGARLAGLREHHGEIVGVAVWPAIINQDTFYELRAFLANRSLGTRPTPRKRPLTGLLFCGVCRSPLGAITSHDRRAFRCKNDGRCERQSVIQNDPLEFFLRDVAFERVLRFPHPDVPNLPESADLLAAARDRLAALEDARYVREEISAVAYARMRAEVEADMEKLSSNMRQRRIIIGGALDRTGLLSAWMEKGVEWRAALLEFVFDRIEVHPHETGGTLEDRISVHLREVA